MNAYPLIYSRTKHEDFVPDFLTRPADFDYKKALRYINDAMKNTDTIDGIRYSAFSVGDYCVCGGISGLTKNMYEEASKLTSLLPGASEYLKDIKGRNINAFVGIAINKNDLRSGKIPDIQLDEYWNIYLTYLKNQWDSLKTSSEKLTVAPLEIKEKTYSSLYTPDFETYGTKTAVINFDKNPQVVIDYFFNEIINKKSSKSFLSNIYVRSDWDAMVFDYASPSERVLSSLRSSVSSKSSETTGYTNGNNNRGSLSDELNKYAPKSTSAPNNEKKTSHSGGKGILAAIGIVIAAVLMIILLMLKVAAAPIIYYTDKHNNQEVEASYTQKK